MGFFTGQTRTVDLGGGNTITVGKISTAEMMDIWNSPDVYGGPQSTGMQRYAMAMTRAAIKGWDGPDFEGRGVSVENINALPFFVLDKIAEVALELNVLSADEKNA